MAAVQSILSAQSVASTTPGVNTTLVHLKRAPTLDPTVPDTRQRCHGHTHVRDATDTPAIHMRTCETSHQARVPNVSSNASATTSLRPKRKLAKGALAPAPRSCVARPAEIMGWPEADRSWRGECINTPSVQCGLHTGHWSGLKGTMGQHWHQGLQASRAKQRGTCTTQNNPEQDDRQPHT